MPTRQRSERRVAIATFGSPGPARYAVQDLRRQSFTPDQIGILTHDREDDRELTGFKEPSGEEAGTGASSSALWGIGVASGVLAGFGPVIAGGVLAILVSSEAGGGLAERLAGLGVSEDGAAYYEEQFRRGRTIVIVDNIDSDDTLMEAYETLRRHGADRRYTTQPKPQPSP